MPHTAIRAWATIPALTRHGTWFPGRVIGGAALVLGPVAWTVALLLRYLALRAGPFTAAQMDWFDRQEFAAASQLAAYQASPALALAGQACFAAGALLLCPAYITLARLIAPRCPQLAAWGGTLTVLGLFARLYFAGVDQTAFQLADAHGAQAAMRFVSSSYVDISYGPWYVPVLASACQYPGMLVLAIGAYRSATFGLARGLLLLMAGTLWGGVLKAADLADVLWYAGLCLALMPLGVRVLRGTLPGAPADPLPGRTITPPPRRLRLLSW
ncbi:hypothetical protein [Sphaerisporangium krabiense]|uniref:DUF4386 domain-containing protein n=1 Tax=Sphaerisporangium krabiense TaxID=763782 RepID=A0A7W8ZCA9_9ACTN|nr:hypothetical protein [Sphaerisporangium krabiense]MBB5631384.1 hypothetical protein [Sphaerisporangium krabiense]